MGSTLVLVRHPRRFHVTFRHKARVSADHAAALAEASDEEVPEPALVHESALMVFDDIGGHRHEAGSMWFWYSWSSGTAAVEIIGPDPRASGCTSIGHLSIRASSAGVVTTRGRGSAGAP
jgi:hypothetical protein